MALHRVELSPVLDSGSSITFNIGFHDKGRLSLFRKSSALATLFGNIAGGFVGNSDAKLEHFAMLPMEYKLSSPTLYEGFLAAQCITEANDRPESKLEWTKIAAKAFRGKETNTQLNADQPQKETEPFPEFSEFGGQIDTCDDTDASSLVCQCEICLWKNDFVSLGCLVEPELEKASPSLNPQLVSEAQSVGDSSFPPKDGEPRSSTIDDSGIELEDAVPRRSSTLPTPATRSGGSPIHHIRSKKAVGDETDLALNPHRRDKATSNTFVCKELAGNTKCIRAQEEEIRLPLAATEINVVAHNSLQEPRSADLEPEAVQGKCLPETRKRMDSWWKRNRQQREVRWGRHPVQTFAHMTEDVDGYGQHLGTQGRFVQGFQMKDNTPALSCCPQGKTPMTGSPMKTVAAAPILGSLLSSTSGPSSPEREVPREDCDSVDHCWRALDENSEREAYHKCFLSQINRFGSMVLS